MTRQAARLSCWPPPPLTAGLLHTHISTPLPPGPPAPQPPQVDPSMGPWSRMHRVMREGTPAANDKFIASTCRTAAAATPADAARSAEVLGAGGATALQVGRPPTAGGLACGAGAYPAGALVWPGFCCAVHCRSCLLPPPPFGCPQAAMGGKSAARVTRSTKQDENNPNNYPA